MDLESLGGLQNPFSHTVYVKVQRLRIKAKRHEHASLINIHLQIVKFMQLNTFRACFFRKLCKLILYFKFL